MAGNELEEIGQRANAALVAALQAAGQIAGVVIEARIHQLQKAAAAGEETASRIRAQLRTRHVADAATWRAASRDSWWRAAGAADIAAVWQAAGPWRQVDARAEQACQNVVERLAERGVPVDPAQPQVGDVEWLSNALDQAAVEGAAAERGPAPVFEVGEVDPAADAVRAQRRAELAERQEKMADLVRKTWPGDRAERVVESPAWPVLSTKLVLLDQDGHDVEAMLRAVPAFIDDPRCHTPAAFAYRRLEDAAAEQDRGDAARGDERDARHEQAAWEDTRSDPPGVAEADDEHAAAEAHAAAAENADAQAAQIAAQGYPDRTDAAVANATDPTRTVGSSRAATRPAVTRKPVLRKAVKPKVPNERGR